MQAIGATDEQTDAAAAEVGHAEERGLLRRWKRRGAGPSDPAMDVGPLMARILRCRGLGDAAAAELFLSPLLKHLHDPSLMPDLDRAAERMLAAAKCGETIAIYGDYDVDGVTATAILYHTLRHICPAAKVVTYVPHRLEEGYGLNPEAIAELADGGATVIVSVDCGITAVEPARVARERGVDLIITDHHNPPADEAMLPPAFAVVHPRRPGSQYPYGELCGAGVAFKLAWRLATMESGGARVSESTRELLLELLGLCSLGVIADVVPLNGENRVIASFGLKRIKHSRLEGLRALVEASGLAGENVEAEDVGFKLGPRLNACGRMGHAREAVELLTTATGPRAIEIATQLSRQNDERRSTEQRILEEAIELAQAAGMTGPDRRAERGPLRGLGTVDRWVQPAWRAGEVRSAAPHLRGSRHGRGDAGVARTVRCVRGAIHRRGERGDRARGAGGDQLVRLRCGPVGVVGGGGAGAGAAGAVRAGESIRAAGAAWRAHRVAAGGVRAEQQASEFETACAKDDGPGDPGPRLEHARVGVEGAGGGGD